MTASDSPLISKAKEIAKLFEVSSDLLNSGVEHFIKLADEGLASNSNKRGLPMIPTFVTGIPTGKEKGVFLAVDLGGTNFRVCSVTLNGDNTFEMKHTKHPIPKDLFSGSAEALFAFFAEKIDLFIKENHNENYQKESDSKNDRLKVGFTFSFPANQTALNRGTLLRWTKGFSIEEVVGKDVILLLQEQLDKRNVKADVVALVNDTTGTLMSRAYSSNPEKDGNTVIGSIFGTGTNGCYVEKIENIPKLDKSTLPAGTTQMVINTEWGSFDNDLKFLPTTKYDEIIDPLTPNPKFHMFEKRISGMFLGEILRQVLVDLYNQKLIFQNVEDMGEKFFKPWTFDSANMAIIEIDDSTDQRLTCLILNQSIHISTTTEERKALQILTHAIAKRSAYLSAIPLAGLLIKTNALNENDLVDIGVDGSVVQYYPGFQDNVREALRLIKQIGVKGEKKIGINVAKDGSGVGAALCASTA